MELVSNLFQQAIFERYNKLRCNTLYFSPLVSTTGIARSLKRWLELVYATPYLTRYLTTVISEKETHIKQIIQPTQLIWNFLVYLNMFPSNQLPAASAGLSMKLMQFKTGGDLNIKSVTNQISESSKVILRNLTTLSSVQKLLSPGPNYQANHAVDSGYRQLQSSTPVVQSLLTQENNEAGDNDISRPGRTENTAVLPGTIRQQLTPGLRTPFVNQQIWSNEPKGYTGGVNLFLNRRYPFRESAVYNEQTLNNSKSELNLPSDEVESSTMRFRSRQASALPRLELEALKFNPSVIREEKQTGKVINSEPSLPQPQPPKINMEYLTDEVYKMLEKKIRIERERRGI